ncbi:MAG: hypothetical protein JXB46_06670, partial [Candidatus Eisenbacteria bacterium]|nr:hypothetical protein [Candidatus Eisenbacteria bacterium]
SVNGFNSWSSIKSARVWVEGLSGNPGDLMIGSMDIVGTQWEPVGIADSTGVVQDPGDMALRLGSKNNKEDADYRPPYQPDVNDQTQSVEREQSLFMVYENLESGYSALAEKVFFSRQDYTGYRSFQFYLYGVPPSGDEVEDGRVFFLRMGADEFNYYEYSTRIRDRWVQARSESAVDPLISVPFSSFTALKLGDYATDDEATVAGLEGERFTRVGSPSLANISRLTIGVRNESSDYVITGEIWLDDIRLSDVRRDMGRAERVTVEAGLADLANLSVDVRHVDSEFHTLGAEWGSGNDNVSYNVNGTVNMDRFVTGLGLSAPVNVTWRKTISRPRLLPNSDVELDATQSDVKRSESLNRSVAVSLSRKRQSPDYWTHLLFDGLSVRASLSESQSRSTTRTDTVRTVRSRVSYRYSPEKKGIRLFRNTELFLKPTNIRFNADVQLTRKQEEIFTASGTRTLESDRHDKKLNADAGIDFQLLDNLGTSHSVSFKRDLGPIHRVIYDLNTGVEMERNYSNSLTFSPKFGRWFAPQYSFSSSFTDDHNPQLRREGDPFAIRNVRAQNSQDIRASFDIKKLLGPGAPARSESANTSRDRTPNRPQDRDRPHPDGEVDDRSDKDETGRADAVPDRPGSDRDRADDESEPQTTEDSASETDERAPPTSREPGESEEETTGPGFGDLARPFLTLLRNADAIDARYSIRRSSRFNRITWDQVPGWDYRLGLTSGKEADDRSEERTLTLDSGVKLTDDIRVKASYKRNNDGDWIKNVRADSSIVITETRSTSQSTGGSLSWNGVHKIGPLSRMFSSVRARSGVEYKTGNATKQGEKTGSSWAFGLNPIISVDATFKNGLTGSFSWDKGRDRKFRYSSTGPGSVTEVENGSMSVSLNYRFSAPQGLKLPFFGQKLKFQSNLDTSLTLRQSTSISRTALDEAGLAQVDPLSSTRDTSVTLDMTYSFSRNVSGGLRVSYSQDRDEKKDTTYRTIGVHLSAEFKF